MFVGVGGVQHDGTTAASRALSQSVDLRPSVMDSFLDGANDMLGDARGFYTDRHSSEHRPADEFKYDPARVVVSK